MIFTFLLFVTWILGVVCGVMLAEWTEKQEQRRRDEVSFYD